MTLSEITLVSISEKQIIDAVFILSRLKEEYCAKGKSCICILRT